MLGVTTRTVMLYDDNGQIAFEGTASSRRIISKERLISYLQDEDLLLNDIFNTKHDIIYARVSTNEQRERGDWDGEREMLSMSST